MEYATLVKNSINQNLRRSINTTVYSTICIAGPLWVEWELHKKAKPRKKKA